MKFKKILIGIVIVIIIIFAVDLWIEKFIFPYKHKEIIEKYSSEYDLDPYFVLAVIKAESKFKANARSNKNACGLMQITEDTAKWIAEQMELTDFSPEKLYLEEYNIKMGCWYLNNLRDEFHNRDLEVAAYNAGRGNVNEWLQNKDWHYRY